VKNCQKYENYQKLIIEKFESFFRKNWLTNKTRFLNTCISILIKLAKMCQKCDNYQKWILENGKKIAKFVSFPKI